jgi:MoxR-like ATPase
LANIDIKKAADLHQRILAEISKVVVGKKEIKEALVLCLIAGGHLLIEGPPGTAKTTVAKSFAETIGGSFKRIQLTPDMMPADITGFYLYTPEGKTNFVQGPLFANIVLADELNRTTPRTQSALLEAMQEQQITIERMTYPLEQPFMVVAAQVQSGGEGTYPLTDVQIDRFLLRIWSEYPSKEEEIQVISNIDRIDTPAISKVTSIAEILEIRQLVKRVQVAPEISEYIVSIVESLRTDPDILSGPSTRSSIALYKCARARAIFDGRDYVIPDDVKQLAFASLEHRVRIKPEAEMDEITPRQILQRTLDKVAVPKLKL